MNKIHFVFWVLLSILLSNCSKDKEQEKQITIEIEEITLFYGDVHQIESSSNLPVTYTSKNGYHASVSKSGLITARFVGETDIVLSNGSDTKKIHVTVKPKNNLYPSPNLEFRLTKEILIAKLGPPDTETLSSMSYTNFSDKAPIVTYFFTDYFKMNKADVYVKSEYSPDLETFLSERYLRIDVDKLLFVNALVPAKSTMIIDAQLYDSSYWLVTYEPDTTHTKTSKIEAGSFDIMFNDSESMEN